MSRISLRTEQVLAEFLKKLSDADSATERNRCRFAQNSNITLENVFNRLDVKRQGSLTQLDLQDYFSSHFKSVSSDEARLLERVIHQEASGRLTFAIVKDQLLPQTSVDHRTRLDTRITSYSLDSYSDKQLFDLLNEELLNSLEVAKVATELAVRQDYDTHELFRMVDWTDSGFVDRVNLNRFLSTHKQVLSDTELEGILQRLGHWHVGKVAGSEFTHCLSRVQGNVLERWSDTKQKIRDVSHLEVLQRSDQHLQRSDQHLKLEDARREKERSGSKLLSPQSPNKINSTLELARSNRSNQGSGTKPRKLLQSDECLLANLWIDTISRDNQVEDLRLQLSSALDFNLYDAYLTFERQNTVHIDVADISQGLDRLGLNRTQAEIENWVRKSAKGSIVLTFEQFSEALFPANRSQTSRVTSRSSNVGAVLASLTRLQLADLLKALVDNVNAILKLKTDLRSKVTWNHQEAWNSVNKLNLNKIGAEDLRGFLQDHRQSASLSELDRLLERQHSRDIQFTDFVDELESRQK